MGDALRPGYSTTDLRNRWSCDESGGDSKTYRFPGNHHKCCPPVAYLMEEKTCGRISYQMSPVLEYSNYNTYTCSSTPLRSACSTDRGLWSWTGNPDHNHRRSHISLPPSRTPGPRCAIGRGFELEIEEDSKSLKLFVI